MQHKHAAIWILVSSSVCLAVEPATATSKPRIPIAESQPATQAATAPKRVDQPLTIRSQLKADAPVTVKNYWAECLEYRPQVMRDAQAIVDSARRTLERISTARIGARPNNAAYSPDIMYYPTYAAKQAAIQSARDSLARQQETYKKISSDAVIFKPLKDPLLQQDKDTPLGSIGAIHYLLINKIVSPTEAIVALNWMPVQMTQSGGNPAYRPGMPPYMMGGGPSATAYLRYPPSPYAYQGGFSYLITGFNTEATIEGSKIQRPILVQITGTRKMQVEGEERSVFILRVLQLEDFFEPE